MTPEPRALLRQIPAVEALLRHSGLEPLRQRLGLTHLTRLVREVLEEARQEILAGVPPEAGRGIPSGASPAPEAASAPPPDAAGPSPDALARRVALRAARLLDAGLTPVINASGVILHTNLGRAPLSAAALRAVQQAGIGYSDVEYDLARGGRGSRMSHVEELLTFLTGAEAALAVNNNAAAVLLALNSLADGREVVVSRGELVEIGGSFRIPEVMEKSGGRLREVGTTNKTHARDYESAISGETALLLKVHASNYRIEGFTAEVPLAELARIGERHGLPVLIDVGSGALVEVSPHGVAREPLVAECLSQGADLVTFSGDKLLGGPQAGLIVGRRDLIQKLKANPLARAVRLDKLTLAGLTATLVEYLHPGTVWQNLPALRMIADRPDDLRERAEALCAALRAAAPGLQVSALPAEAAVGGGALPLEGLSSWVAAVDPGGAADLSGAGERNRAGQLRGADDLPAGRQAGVSPDALERALRAGTPPVIARIQADRVLFDLRTLTPEEAEALPELVAQALERARRSGPGSH